MLNADMEMYNEILNLDTRKYIVISDTERRRDRSKRNPNDDWF